MNLTFRSGTAADIETCGQICYDAFCAISSHHNFPPDFPSVEVANGLMGMVFSTPGVYSVIVEIDGRVVGSNFLWEHASIGGIGPITVDNSVQNSAIGRRLMEDVLNRAKGQKLAGVRLVQAGFHNRSLALYTKLGFVVRESLVQFQGEALQLEIPGYKTRAAQMSDVEACNTLCREVHGFERGVELQSAIAQGTALVVEHDHKITGYATSATFFGHTVGRSNEDLKALIGASDAYQNSGFLLPTRNSEMFRWCLEKGLRIVQPLNLMSLGLYNEPQGVFMPSVLF